MATSLSTPCLKGPHSRSSCPSGRSGGITVSVSPTVKCQLDFLPLFVLDDDADSFRLNCNDCSYLLFEGERWGSCLPFLPCCSFPTFLCTFISAACVSTSHMRAHPGLLCFWLPDSRCLPAQHVLMEVLLLAHLATPPWQRAEPLHLSMLRRGLFIG